jgi:phosphinothricin acetyltransferase
VSNNLAEGARPIIRDAMAVDMPAVGRIYKHYVETALVTFEETPPRLEEMLARRQKVADAGAPYLVAELGGEIVGYCYAGPYHHRPAYRYTLEDSVYVAHGMSGRGYGAALLGELIKRCERGPWRQLLAVIGNSDNAGSIALHRRFGFTSVGVLRSVGFKFGRWLDVPLMQRMLGPGDAEPPAGFSAAKSAR